jgi:hypothetical protein
LFGEQSNQVAQGYNRPDGFSTPSNIAELGMARHCCYCPKGTRGIVADLLNSVKNGGRCIVAAIGIQSDYLSQVLLEEEASKNLKLVSISFYQLKDRMKCKANVSMIVAFDVLKVSNFILWFYFS